jgi:NADH:ubiquinone oxidoreductase subunit E
MGIRMDITAVDRILEKYRGDRSALIAILQDVQEHYRFIPEEAAARISAEMDIPFSRIYSLATFYKAFTLTPRARYPISVCMGTACHVQGAPRILEKLERDLNIKTGETTADGNFGLETVRCLGCCGLAPVVTVGEDLYGKVTLTGISKILNKYQAACAGKPDRLVATAVTAEGNE